MSDKPQADVRLDKWLWAARFFKTRSIAKDAIESGKVHYNGTRAKTSKTVAIGAEIRIRQGFDEKTVLVQQLSEQRGPASIAQQLYVETEQSIASREANAQQRKNVQFHAPDQRPDKKERRQLLQIKQHLE